MRYFDWNGPAVPARPVRLFDETLRAARGMGPQGTEIIGAQLALLHELDRLGVAGADLGTPGSAAGAWDELAVLLREIQRQGIALVPAVGAGPALPELARVAALQESCGIALDTQVPLAHGPTGKLTGFWDIKRVEQSIADLARACAGMQLSLRLVVDDAVRTSPSVLGRIARVALDCGVPAVCLSDTDGHATPAGVTALLRFVCACVTSDSAAVRVEWRGHDSSGLGVINALTALAAGAGQVHAALAGAPGVAVKLDALIRSLQRYGYRPAPGLAGAGTDRLLCPVSS